MMHWKVRNYCSFPVNKLSVTDLLADILIFVAYNYEK